METLKRAVIKSLGRVLRQIIKDKKVRFQQMSVADILARVRAKYGKMQKDTKLTLKDFTSHPRWSGHSYFELAGYV